MLSGEAGNSRFVAQDGLELGLISGTRLEQSWERDLFSQVIFQIFHFSLIPE